MSLTLHLDDVLAVGQDDILLRHYVRQVLLDRLFDPLLVPLLVSRAFPMQRPVVVGDGHAGDRVVGEEEVIWHGGISEARRVKRETDS